MAKAVAATARSRKRSQRREGAGEAREISEYAAGTGVAQVDA
jgi:hypothetical protein